MGVVLSPPDDRRRVVGLHVVPLRRHFDLHAAATSPDSLAVSSMGPEFRCPTTSEFSEMAEDTAQLRAA